eukprot:7454938-Alexandrium_andersonii.AAC.1
MSASLVGSEMCIRDRAEHLRRGLSGGVYARAKPRAPPGMRRSLVECAPSCLLYTSDAADDM